MLENYAIEHGLSPACLLDIFHSGIATRVASTLEVRPFTGTVKEIFNAGSVEISLLDLRQYLGAPLAPTQCSEGEEIE